MVQNSKGDTPLHVKSPLCISNWRGLASPALHENEDVRSKLAQEAISLVLSTPDAVEARLLRENSAIATPLHIALASGAHDCVIEALLSASPASVGSEDGRGMLPLHWAAAFGRASYGGEKTYRTISSRVNKCHRRWGYTIASGSLQFHDGG